MREKRLIWNTLTSLINQIVTIVCGFVLPRAILAMYGSDINGLVSSITQFLSIIAFLEFGVGAVVQSSLYKPLANNDEYSISAILSSANNFFRKIAGIMALYILLLCIFYPLIITNFNRSSTIILIVAMSISSFAQYYFGITYQLLLTADQKGYIVYLLQSFTIILNTIVCTALIYAGASIQIVKITTSVIFLLRPIGQMLYVRYHYSIDNKVKYDFEPISQKWNGLAQHVAAVVLDNTDIIILTCFSTLENVSIYSVYFMVVRGVKQLFLSMTSGIQALLGELWAKQEKEKLKGAFIWTEWVIHTGGSLIFGCTSSLIVQFVQIYTKGITDANYIDIPFAFLLTLSHAFHCLRLPYNMMVLAAGRYKQTQKVYIIAAAINIIISIIAVHWFGLIGITLGTLTAMAYQTIWLAIYVSNSLVDWSVKSTLKQFVVDFMTVGVGVFVTNFVKLSSISYVSWIALAFEKLLAWCVIIVIVNVCAYPEKCHRIRNKLSNKISCLL